MSKPRRYLKVIIESDGCGVRMIMKRLSTWLDAAPANRKVMYVEQRVGEPFDLPDEEPETELDHKLACLEMAFKAGSSAGYSRAAADCDNLPSEKNADYDTWLRRNPSL